MSKYTYAIILAEQGNSFSWTKTVFRVPWEKLWEHLYDTVSSVIPKSQIVVVGVDIMGAYS